VIENDGGLFGRLPTAMVTPFDEKLDVDWTAVDRVVDHLIETGTTAIVVNGTTGESPTLEEDEQVELLKRTIARAKSRVKIVMGTGTNSTRKTVKATQKAEALGADGVLVVVPYYNKPSAAGLFAHYSEVASCTTLPIMLYNIPGRTGINLPVETTVELAETFPNIFALKDSTSNTDQTAEIAKKARRDFHIYTGDDQALLPFLGVGACGVVSVASHIVGSQIAKCEKEFFSGNLDAARSIYYEYLPLFRGLFTAPNPTCIKYAMSTLGLCKPHLRLPLIELNAQQRETLDALLSSVKLDKTTSTSPSSQTASRSKALTS